MTAQGNRATAQLGAGGRQAGDRGGGQLGERGFALGEAVFEYGQFRAGLDAPATMARPPSPTTPRAGSTCCRPRPRTP